MDCVLCSDQYSLQRPLLLFCISDDFIGSFLFFYVHVFFLSFKKFLFFLCWFFFFFASVNKVLCEQNALLKHHSITTYILFRGTQFSMIKLYAIPS